QLDERERREEDQPVEKRAFQRDRRERHLFLIAVEREVGPERGSALRIFVISRTEQGAQMRGLLGGGGVQDEIGKDAQNGGGNDGTGNQPDANRPNRREEIERVAGGGIGSGCRQDAVLARAYVEDAPHAPGDAQEYEAQ